MPIHEKVLGCKPHVAGSPVPRGVTCRCSVLGSVAEQKYTPRTSKEGAKRRRQPSFSPLIIMVVPTSHCWPKHFFQCNVGDGLDFLRP